jgi:V/A-type H+-transporting ATPase subunit E
MNDLKALTGSIIDQAKAEAEQITRQTAAEVEQILTQAKQQAGERSRKLAGEYQQKAEAVERRLTIEAELEGKKRILAVKRALIEQAFQQAIDSLPQLPEAQRIKFLAVQLAAAGAEHGGTVQAAGAPEEWASIIKEANEILARSGKLAQLTLAKEPPDFSDGFRLIGPGYTVDGSYRAIIGEIKETMVPEVSDYLFAKAGE